MSNDNTGSRSGDELISEQFMTAQWGNNGDGPDKCLRRAQVILKWSVKVERVGTINPPEVMDSERQLLWLLTLKEASELLAQAQILRSKSYSVWAFPALLVCNTYTFTAMRNRRWMNKRLTHNAPQQLRELRVHVEMTAVVPKQSWPCPDIL